MAGSETKPFEDWVMRIQRLERENTELREIVERLVETKCQGCLAKTAEKKRLS